MSFIARANLPLSVTLTAIATLLAPLITPALMQLLAGQFVAIDFWDMMLGIVDMVILPIVAGLMFHAVAYGTASTRGKVLQALAYVIIISVKNIIFYTTSSATLHAATLQFFSNLFWFFLLPLAGGYFFRLWAGGSKEFLDKALAFISMAGIAIIITIITANGRDSLLQMGLLLILACLLHNISGYTLGYFGSRLLGLDERSCRTIALEVGMQNGGLASGIALQMGKVATVGLAPAVFGPLMNITGSSLATWWRGKKIPDQQHPDPK
jgi:BASS family bile acid:Na+ symporter